MQKTRAQIKLEAREIMREKRGDRSLGYVYALLTAGLSALVSGVLLWQMEPLLMKLIYSILMVDNYYQYEYVIYQFASSLVSIVLLSCLFSIILGLFTWFVDYGYRYGAREVVLGGNTGPARLFEAKNMPGRVLALGFLVALFSFLWSMLFNLISSVLGFIMGDAFYTFAFIIEIVVYFAILFVTARYFFAPYAQVEYPEEPATISLRRSKDLARGRSGEIVLFQLSFIGWAILISVIVFVIVFIVEFATFYRAAEVAYYTNSPTAFIDVLDLKLWLLVPLLTLITLPYTQWLSRYMTIAQTLYFRSISGLDEQGEVINMNNDNPPSYDPDRTDNGGSYFN